MKSVAAFASFRVRLERSLARALVLLSLVTAFFSGPARADEPTDRKPPREAIDAYNRGRAHYQAGRYREAVVELEKALSLDPNSPNLVYNVARVHELLGEIDEAIHYYKRYAEMLPSTEREERERVEATLQRLEGAKTQVVSPDTQAAPPPQMKRGVADPTFWLFASASAVSLAGGTVTGVLAIDAANDAENFVLGKDGTNRERDDQVHRATRLALATDVLLLVGTTLAVTSLLLYVLREEPVEAKEPRGASLRFGASTHGAMIAIGGNL